MYKDINIDSVLLKFNAIDSDKLKEDKIDIDLDLMVENSSQEYIKEFAMFLNELCCTRGIVLSESIFKKFMDIINYEGYEYQIVQQYVTIINNIVYRVPYNEYNMYIKYKDYNFDNDQCIEFINKYLKEIQSPINEDGYIHFLHPMEDDSNKRMYVEPLKEVEYPIDFLYRSIKEFPATMAYKLNIDKVELYQQAMYIIYQNNLPAYKAILSRDNLLKGLYFLLEEDTDKARDILLEYIDSLHTLFYLLDQLPKVNDSVKKNIKVIVEDIIARSTKPMIVEQIMNIF